MANNDTFLIDGIIDEVYLPNMLSQNDRGKAFEVFSNEQVLKDYALSKEDISFCSVDGENDGGIDNFYIFINGHLLVDIEKFVWPRSNAKLEVFIVSCKHHDTFVLDTIDALYPTVSELFDFEIQNLKLTRKYNEKIIKKREFLMTSYRKIAFCSDKFLIKFFYISRGDTSKIAPNIQKASEQITSTVKGLFSGVESSFSFIGGSELLELYRKKKNYSLDLEYTNLLQYNSQYVAIVKLNNYYKFITDEDQKLRRYLFDANVRDFMGLNVVNSDIMVTLLSNDSTDFWWLNNGVTILSSKAFSSGNILSLENIKIVNGLQTSETIYNFFQNGKNDVYDRSILIKILKIDNTEVQKRVIKAANNQTRIETSVLHATDKIQHDIEMICLKHNVYYERRPNFYVNQGYHPNDIITPLSLAAMKVAIIHKQPHHACRLKGKFMQNPDKYSKIFSEKFPIDVWGILGVILKKTDTALSKIERSKTDVFFQKTRYIVAFITIARIYKSFDYSLEEIQRIDIAHYTDVEIMQTVDFLKKNRYWNIAKVKIKSAAYVNEICNDAQREFCIAIGHAFFSDKYPYEDVYYSESQKTLVLQSLPKQPWPVGIHKELASRLNMSPYKVFEIISLLIEEGKLFRQKNGVVYDKQGEVISFDPCRVTQHF